jgi:hypothetical protein
MNNNTYNSSDLTEKMIRYAMANSQSNAQAANFLNVAYNTYKKYAKSYFDKETGLSLFEYHKNQEGKGISKGGLRTKSYVRLKEILAGLHPEYPAKRMKKRVDDLINQSYLEEKCYRCGFQEKRIVDYSIPLLLDWVDGDTTNHKRGNLQLLCYNCYYLTVDNVAGKKLNLF